MKRIVQFADGVGFLSYAAVGGKEESLSPLSHGFDLFDTSDLFGQKTWELAEGEMGRIALNLALAKATLSPDEVDILVAGDLQNQCVASSGGLYSFGIPYLGLYGACSTCTESLFVLSLYFAAHQNLKYGAVVTTSHNSAAERQFRTPLEYGGQRPPSAQWTATAGGAFLLGKGGSVKIIEGMAGKIVDGGIPDATNMGAAMAPAAFDTVRAYFKESGARISDFDAIVTGDLGEIGSKLFLKLLLEEGIDLSKKHLDCGCLLYDKKIQDVHSGGSGCGCSASVLASHFLPKLSSHEMHDILFLSTGALMSPTSVQQGENIFGIAPLVHIQSTK